METTLINHPRLRVGLRTGAEGPRDDPYHFEEFSIDVPKGRVMLHFGLGDWATINKTSVELVGFTEAERAKFLREDFIKTVTGYTMKQLMRIARKATERCRNCGSQEYVAIRGYPGEHFTVCAKCNHIVDTYFDISEIE